MSAAAYQAVDVLAADGPRLVLLLYDGALQRLGQAELALGRGDVAAFARHVSRAHTLVAALAGALDEQAGGELARTLATLYHFMLLHLTRGLAARSPAPLREVAGLLRTLREGFAAAAVAPRS